MGSVLRVRPNLYYAYGALPPSSCPKAVAGTAMAEMTTRTPDERNGAIVRVLLLVLVLNWVVSLAKLLLGYFTGALSVAADGVHSFFDGISNVIGIVGMSIAAKPPDSEHPYGHRKYEILATAGIALLLLLAIVRLVQAVWNRFEEPLAPTVEPLSFVVMVGTLAVNIGVTRYETRQGRELDSMVLLADASHTKSDVFVSTTVIAGLLAVLSGFEFADPLVAIVVLIVIGRVAYKLLRPTIHALTDRALVDTPRIVQLAMSVPGVQSVHRVRTRGDASYIFLDMHIQLPDDLPIVEGHRLSHAVKGRIMAALPQVKDVIIHIEPAGENPPKENEPAKPH